MSNAFRRAPKDRTGFPTRLRCTTLPASGLGYDNAHPTQMTGGPGGRKTRSQDHVHRGDTIRPYRFTDAATLLADFWMNVDRILESKGVKK